MRSSRLAPVDLESPDTKLLVKTGFRALDGADARRDSDSSALTDCANKLHEIIAYTVALGDALAQKPDTTDHTEQHKRWRQAQTLTSKLERLEKITVVFDWLRAQDCASASKMLHALKLEIMDRDTARKAAHGLKEQADVYAGIEVLQDAHAFVVAVSAGDYYTSR